MIGGLALLATAAGAVTVTQAVSSHQPRQPAHRSAGSYAASYADEALGERNATRVSRSGVRPVVDGTERAQIAALRRDKTLKQNAALAQAYAKKLVAGQWITPIAPGTFRLSTLYGAVGPYWADGWHTGDDLVAPYGTPCVAVTDATVTKTGWAGSYGQQVVLELPGGMQIWYNHLSSIDVVVGQQVVEGQLVGRVGETGNAYGTHLHFEIYLPGRYHYGEAVDPMPIMNAHGASL